MGRNQGLDMDEMMKPGMDKMGGMAEMPEGQPMDAADPMAKLKQAKVLIEEAMAAMGGEESGEADDGRIGMEEAFGKGFQGY